MLKHLKGKTMAEIEKMDHICQYNDLIGQETLHPLVSVPG